MGEATFAFVADREAVGAQFRGVGPRELTLSLLAGVPPEPAWEGCRVEEGESPLGPETFCIATRGPGAGELQLRLVEAFERHGVCVLQVYEGGPEAGTPLATAHRGRWS